MPSLFRRGDDNGDGTVDVSDPINSLSVQFLGTGFAGCIDAMDFNDDGRFDVSDPIANMSYQFLGTALPPAPGKDVCGPDPTPDNKNGNTISGEEDDELGCEVYPAPSDPLDPTRQCD